MSFVCNRMCTRGVSMHKKNVDTVVTTSHHDHLHSSVIIIVIMKGFHWQSIMKELEGQSVTSALSHYWRTVSSDIQKSLASGDRTDLQAARSHGYKLVGLVARPAIMRFTPLWFRFTSHHCHQ